MERRYDGLLRAGTALLEEGKATESEVVGSLVFAALAPVVPELERIQCLFAAATGAEWDGLALRFYNTFELLEAKRVVDGLLVVGRASNRVEVVYEPETGLVDSIVLEVDDLSVTAGKVRGLYERALSRYDLRWSDSEDGPISGEPCEGTIRMIARLTWGRSAPACEEDRRLFPPPDQVRAYFARQRRSTVEDLQGRPSGPAFHRGNLIAACVAWQLGARGALVKKREARGRLLRKNRVLEPAIAALLNETGLAQAQWQRQSLPRIGWANKKTSLGKRIERLDAPLRRIESILWCGPALGSRDLELPLLVGFEMSATDGVPRIAPRYADEVGE